MSKLGILPDSYPIPPPSLYGKINIDLMIFKLTCKNCTVSDSTGKYIDRHLDKIGRMVEDFAPDLVVIRMVLRKNVDKYHPPRLKDRPFKDYSDTKPALANFEGSITLRLNRNRLYASFKGQTIEECADTGFGRIIEQIDKHKETHFSSDSRYPDRATIRGI